MSATARSPLYAALEVHTGHVEGMTTQRHTSDAFITFLDKVVATQPTDREIHIIYDNLSAHKDQGRKGLARRSPLRPYPLHAHLQLLAQSSRNLVRQDPA